MLDDAILAIVAAAPSVAAAAAATAAAVISWDRKVAGISVPDLLGLDPVEMMVCSLKVLSRLRIDDGSGGGSRGVSSSLSDTASAATSAQRREHT